MKSWINQHKRQIQTLIFCQILTILCFGQWFGIHYNADGYMTNIKDWNVLAADMVDRNVRPVTAAFYFIFGLLNLNYEQVFIVQTALFIISNSIQIYVIYKLASNNAQTDKHNIWIFLAQAQVVFTPYLISTMVFIEYGIMSLQITLQILAVYQTVIDKKTGLSINKLISIILLIIQLCIYQQIPAIFVIVSMFIVSSDIDKQSMHRVIEICLEYAAACLIYLIIYKICNQQSGYATNNDGIILNIYYIIAYTALKTKSINTMNIYIVEASMFWIQFIVSTISYKIRTNKQLFTQIFRNIILIIISYIVAYDFIIVGKGYLVPRNEISTGYLTGLYLLDSLINIVKIKQSGIFDNKSKTIEIISKVMIVISLFVVVVTNIEAQTDQYKLNAAEKQRAASIEDRINQYESETGNHIDSIAFYMDKRDDFIASANVNNDRQPYEDVLKANWASNFYLETYIKDRQFSIADKDSNIENYFSSNNWTTDSDDLYIFKDNILHLCAY